MKDQTTTKERKKTPQSQKSIVRKLEKHTAIKKFIGRDVSPDQVLNMQ